MVSHPNRSQSDLGAAARRIMRKHQLKLVELRIDHHGVYAGAIPEPHHPIVAERRAAAFAKAGNSLSMSQISGLSDSFYEPIARGRGKTIAEAIESLSAALPPPPLSL